MNTFNLEANDTYILTIANTGGAQENAGAEGDLDIDNTNGGVPGGIKTYVFNGNGATISASYLDRVVQILGSDVVVQFKDLRFQNGEALDNGAAGKTIGQEDAHGGAVLNGGALADDTPIDGGQVSFTSCRVQSNCASGYDGGNGAGTNAGVGDPGHGGVDGRAARGGGLYSVSGLPPCPALARLESMLEAESPSRAGGTGADLGGNGGAGGTARGGGVASVLNNVTLRRKSLWFRAGAMV